jgi:hypothetical protein
MLEGIRTNPIIVGAYSTRDGICPMLAAHRAGGRTDLIAFARAWDRFATGGARRRLKTRRATDRELLILRTHLEASLLEQETEPLASAIHEHQLLVATRPAASSRPAAPERATAHHRPGDLHRAGELEAKPGWAWTRLFRRYDEYERALGRLSAAAHAAPEPTHAAPEPTNAAPR